MAHHLFTLIRDGDEIKQCTENVGNSSAGEEDILEIEGEDFDSDDELLFETMTSFRAKGRNVHGGVSESCRAHEYEH